MVDFEETKFAKQAKHKKRIREMKVKIKSLPDSSDFEFEVDATSTVLALKRNIEERYKHNSAHQKLIHSGKVLRDDAKLSTFQLTEGEFLVLVVKTPSGVTKVVGGSGTPQGSKTSNITGAPVGTSLPSATQHAISTPLQTNIEPSTPNKETLSQDMLDSPSSVEETTVLETPKQNTIMPPPAAPADSGAEQKKKRKQEAIEQKTREPKVQETGGKESPAKKQNSRSSEYTAVGQFTAEVGNLVDNPFMSDMVFIVGQNQHKIPGHSVILGARSKVFQALLFPDRPSQDVKGEEKKILVPGIEPEVFRDLLQYLYTGSVTLTEGNTQQLFAAANEYQLSGLKEACVKFGCDNLSVNNVLHYLRGAIQHKYNHEFVIRLQRYTLCGDVLFFPGHKYRTSHADRVSSEYSKGDLCPDFGQRYFNSARNCLVQSFVEVEVLGYGYQIKCHSKHKNDNVAAKDLAKLVRIPQISPKDILNLVKPAKLVADEVLFAAMAFHAAPEEYASNPDKNFKPRAL